MINGNVLLDRSLIVISGEESKEFLQGLITNDIKNLGLKQIVYSLMLTPQGKFLYDFFLFENSNRIFLDCLRQDRDEIIAKFNLYKLGKNIEIVKNDDLDVVFCTSKIDGFDNDPRFSSCAFRGYIAKEKSEDFLKLHNVALNEGSYNQFLSDNTFADASYDMIKSKSFPLEYNMDSYHAISFQKGCYVGQELVARTKYRGTIRKGLYRVEAVENIHADKGDDVIVNGKVAGIFCSAYKNIGKVLLRHDSLEDACGSGNDIEGLIGDLKVKISNSSKL